MSDTPRALCGTIIVSNGVVPPDEYQAWADALAAHKALSPCCFCGKLRSQVRAQIAGNGHLICDECIGLCVEQLESGEANQ